MRSDDAGHASERPLEERTSGESADPEATDADAAEQSHFDDDDVQARPASPPPREASEADAAEQQREVPLDDEYDQ